MVLAAGYTGFDSRLPRFWQASIGSICTQAREVLVVASHDLCLSNHIFLYRPHMIHAPKPVSFIQASRDPCVRSILLYMPHIIRASKPISFTQASHDPCVAGIRLLHVIRASKPFAFKQASHDPCVPSILLAQAPRNLCIQAALLRTGLT